MTGQINAVIHDCSSQIFDTVIVVTSFVLDLVFAKGMTDSDGEQAAVIIMLFLLWRILRIVNSQYNFARNSVPALKFL